jgi:hypothetical protein
MENAMNLRRYRQLVSQILVVVGLAAMLLGALDPLDGCLVIVAGNALVACGASLGKSRYSTLLVVALILVILGLVAMFAIGWMGGVGGRSGHTAWWLLCIVTYPIGWLMGLLGVVAMAGRGWQRIFLATSVVLVVIAVTALIIVCQLRHVPHSVFAWVVGGPYLAGLTMALFGAVLRIVRSFRAGEPAA